MLHRLIIGALCFASASLATAEPPTSRPTPQSGLVRVIRGHTDGVLDVAYSPDGLRIASASADRTARVWDVATGKELLRLKGHTWSVTKVAYSGDGRRIVTGSADGTARVWDAANGDLLAILDGRPRHVHCIAISFDGKIVATGGCDGVARAWDVDQERQLAEVHHGEVVHAVALSRDGKILVSSGGRREESGDMDAPLPFGLNCEIDITDVVGNRPIEKISPKYLADQVSFSADGTRLMYACTRSSSNQRQPLSTLTVYDAKTWVEQKSYTVVGRTEVAAISQDQSRILCADRARVRYHAIADPPQPELVTFQVGEPRGHGVALAPDGIHAAGCSGGDGDPYNDTPMHNWDSDSRHASAIVIWDLTRPAAQPLAYPFPAGAKLSTASFSPDGRQALAMLSDGSVRLLSLSDAKELQRFDVYGVWDIQGGAAARVRPCTAISPDGKSAAASTPGGAKIWDLASGKLIRHWAAKDAMVASIAFSADSRSLLVACLPEGKFPWPPKIASPPRMIDLKSGEELLKFTPGPPKGHGQMSDWVAASADGKYVATASGGSYYYPTQIVIWDAKTGAELRRCVSDAYDTRTIAISSTGLVAARTPHEVVIWNVETGKVVQRLDRMFGWVGVPRFLTDGSGIAVTWEGGQAAIWDPRTGRVLRTAESLGSGTDWGGFSYPDVLVREDGSAIVLIDGTDKLVIAPVTFH